MRFVADNAAELLGADAATVLPVSARLALAAKLDAGSEAVGGALVSADVEAALEPDPRWRASRFGSLERFMLSFLTGALGSPPNRAALVDCTASQLPLASV